MLTIGQQVLNGELPEQTVSDQIMVQEMLQTELLHRDRVHNHGRPRGYVSRHEVISALRKLFPVKSELKLHALKKARTRIVVVVSHCLGSVRGADGWAARQALQYQVQSNHVEYARLFEETELGDQGPFCEELRDQHLEDLLEFHADLRVRCAVATHMRLCLRVPTRALASQAELAKLGKTVGAGSVHPVDFARVLLKVDPSKPRREIEQHLARVFGCLPEDVFAHQALAVPFAAAVRKLMLGGLIKRTGVPEAPTTDPTLAALCAQAEGGEAEAGSQVAAGGALRDAPSTAVAPLQ